jgi:pyruvate dehydrogenase E2 component (dihydrolipoamide acetyltransferase)
MAETVSMPKLGFDMQEGTLVRWVKNEGEQVNKGDVLAEIETDKATVEVESSVSGTVRKLLVGPGSVVPIGSPIAIVGSPDETITEPAAPSADQKKKTITKSEVVAPANKPAMVQPQLAPGINAAAAAMQVPSGSESMKASPLARRMAGEKKLDLNRVQGSGPGGRIVRKDVEAVLSGGISLRSAAGVPSFIGRGAQQIEARQDETIKLSKLRQIIARRMTESKVSVPHFYVTHEYRMEALLTLRKQMNQELADDEKLSVNDFIVKAAALTLKEYPNLNASFGGDQVIRHGSINIGVAVAVENGLLTVVCQNCDQKPVWQIASELREMVARARSGKVKPEDIEGSTFSVSNMGMYDVENFSAILNPPEAGILAVGSAREVPVVEAGSLQVGWRMKATVSVDHRVSDGAEAARYMQSLAKFIEQPWRLLL